RRPPRRPPLFPSTTLFRSANPLGRAHRAEFERSAPRVYEAVAAAMRAQAYDRWTELVNESLVHATVARYIVTHKGEEQLGAFLRSEEHTSELQSRVDLVCR